MARRAPREAAPLKPVEIVDLPAMYRAVKLTDEPKRTSAIPAWVIKKLREDEELLVFL